MKGMGRETIIRPDKDLAALAERAAAGEQIVLLLPDGTRVELRPQPLGGSSGGRPDRVSDPNGVAWLKRHRILPDRAPSQNAAELVRTLRDEGL
jgi:hypothetical protein